MKRALVLFIFIFSLFKIDFFAFEAKGKLMIKRVACIHPSEFEKSIHAIEETVTATKQPLFVLFTGSKSTSSGLSWCPDCVRADPIIESALSSITGGCSLLVCDVERESYRSKDYAYRINPKINLKCVPTLMKWSNGKSIASLNDSQCQQEDLVKELVSE